MRVQSRFRVPHPACFCTIHETTDSLENAGRLLTNYRKQIQWLSLRTRLTLAELKEARLAARQFPLEILVSVRSGDAAARGTINHADLHQVRLVHLFDGVFLFGKRGGERAEANRAARIFIKQYEPRSEEHTSELQSRGLI